MSTPFRDVLTICLQSPHPKTRFTKTKMSEESQISNGVNSLLEKLKNQNRPEADLTLIKKAYDFANQAHGGQKRKSGEPYIVHPLATATALAEMRSDTPTIAASLLHDVCEDTTCSIEEIRKNFGEEIAFLVYGV